MLTIIQPTTNLDTILSAAKAGQAFQLVKGGKYAAAKPIIPTAGNWSLDANGVQVDFAAPGTVFLISQPNIIVSNLLVCPTAANKNSVLFRVQAAGCQVINCVAKDGLGQFGISNPGGVGAIFKGNTIGVTLSCALYAEEDGAQWINNTLVGSTDEAPLRVDLRSGGTNAQRPKGTVITGNTVRTLNNKGVMEIRMCQGLTCTANTFYDWFRIGQDNAPVPNNDCTDVVITGNTWPLFPNLPTINICLMIKAGSTVTAKNNSFVAVATSYFASVDEPSAVVFSGNVRHIAKGVPPRAIYWTGKSTHVTDDKTFSTVVTA